MNRSLLYFILGNSYGCRESWNLAVYIAKANKKHVPSPVITAGGDVLNHDIHTKHELLNDLVCFEKFRDWASDSEQWEKNETKLKQVSSAFAEYSKTVKTERLQQNLKRIAEYTSYTQQKQQVQYLIKVHRILHDFDVLLNGYNEKLWHVTSYENM
jgi:hypothetical protein